MPQTIRLSTTYLFNSDPTCRQIEDRFWLFTTHDQASPAFVSPDDSWQNMFDYHAWSTTDLVHWDHHGSIISAFDIPWAKGCTLWDGDAGIPAPDGAYLAYIPVQNTTDHTWEIGVFESTTPGGHYHDILGRPLISNHTLESAGFSGFRRSVCLSPTIVYDTSHQPYLLFGQFRVFAVPLAPSLRSLAGAPFEIVVPTHAGGATEYIEGPMIHKIGSKWVFTYMTYKDWDAPNPNFTPEDPNGPYLQYCTANSIWGPYGQPRHWMYPLEASACNNQQSLARFNNQWVVCYHIPWNQTEHRHVIVRTFEPDEDTNGTFLEPIHPAIDLANPQTVDAIVTLVPSEALRWAHDACSWTHASVKEGPQTAHHMQLEAQGSLLFPRFLLDGSPIEIEVAILGNTAMPTEISFTLESARAEGLCSDDSTDDQYHNQHSQPFAQEPTLLATIRIPATSTGTTILDTAGHQEHPHWTFYRVQATTACTRLLGNLHIVATKPVSIVWFRIVSGLTKAAGGKVSREVNLEQNVHRPGRSHEYH